MAEGTMMTNKRLLDRLDDVANLTGIPKIAEHPIRRRHFRWLPLLALALACPGFGLPMLGVLKPGLGYALLMGGFVISTMVSMMGPLKPWGEMADERERELRRSAYFAAFMTVTAVTMIGLFTLAALVLLQDWPRLVTVQMLGMFALFLMTLLNSVPTLYASWSTDPLSDDDEG